MRISLWRHVAASPPPTKDPSMRAPSGLALSLSATLLLTACGGGGGGSPTPLGPTVTMTLPATLTFGGGCAEIRESGDVVLPPLSLFVADYGVNASRSIFTFFVGAGEDREVVSATLRLVPAVTHGDPLQGFTNGLRAERVNISGAFDAFDYDVTPAVGAPSPMSPVPGDAPGVIDLDVTDQFRGWIGSGSNFFYLRVRLDHLLNNMSIDGYEFDLDGGGNPALIPTLIAEMR